MSFDVFVQAFDSGGAGEAEADQVRAALAPHVTTHDESTSFVRLETGDGGADLYGYDRLESGFMVNHIGGAQAWDVIVGAAAASRLVIMPVGCPIALTDRATVADLPAELRRTPLALVSSGHQLLSLIQERIWPCPVCYEPVLEVKPYAAWPPEDLSAIDPPYEDHLGPPSSEVCPSCGFEFGQDDRRGKGPGRSFEAYREAWERQG